MEKRVKEALRAVQQAAKRVASSTGRIARRNARRDTWGKMKALRNAINADYPAIEKPKPAVVAEPKPEKPKLPFKRRFEPDEVILFLELIHNEAAHNRPTIEPHAHAEKASMESGGSIHLHKIYVGTEWSNGLKWMQVIHWIRQFLGRTRREDLLAGVLTFEQRIGMTDMQQSIELYRVFWTSGLPSSDLRLAAAQQELIEKTNGRQLAKTMAVNP